VRTITTSARWRRIGREASCESPLRRRSRNPVAAGSPAKGGASEFDQAAENPTSHPSSPSESRGGRTPQPDCVLSARRGNRAHTGARPSYRRGSPCKLDILPSGFESACGGSTPPGATPRAPHAVPFPVVLEGGNGQGQRGANAANGAGLALEELRLSRFARFQGSKHARSQPTWSTATPSGSRAARSDARWPPSRTRVTTWVTGRRRRRSRCSWSSSASAS
jgi:hypothetical protein